MKISRPTRETITNITAASGSRTQPNFSQRSPNWNQGKLNTCRAASPDRPERSSALTKATQEFTSASDMEPIAREAANFRWRCLAKALNAAAIAGSAGMSQR